MSKDTQPHTTSSRRSFKQISFKVRQLIEFLFRKKTPVSQIARELGFHRSTIYRELKRGHVTHVDSQLRKVSTYSADRTQDASFHSSVFLMRSLIRDSKMSPYAAIGVAKRKNYEVPVCSGILYNDIYRFNFLAAPS